MLEVEILLLLLTFIAILVAVISDIKTTEVPDYSNYFLIFSALSLRILYSLLTKDWNFALAIVKTFPFIFLLALIMYKFQQWGGGDVKLLFGLSIALATYPSFLLTIFTPKIVFLSFPLIIFLNILIVGALYSFVYAAVLALRAGKKFSHEFIQTLNKRKKPQTLILILSSLLILTSFTIQNKFITISIALLIPLMFFIFIFISSVEKSSLIKKIPTSKLLEGDWILENVMHKNKIIHHANQELTKEQIKKIRNANIKYITVKQGIVFTPAILLALIASLVFGNLILYLI